MPSKLPRTTPSSVLPAAPAGRGVCPATDVARITRRADVRAVARIDRGRSASGHDEADPVV